MDYKWWWNFDPYPCNYLIPLTDECASLFSHIHTVP